MITIVDYGMGNLGSIKNMLKKIGSDSVISNDPAVIKEASKIILPGVGAFDNGMQNLKELNLISLLNEKVLVHKTPTLGICLGMQLMTNASEEGVEKGLAWIDAETIRFENEMNGIKLRIPHMGWEFVQKQKESKLLDGMYDEPKFYFVHSYFVKCKNKNDVLLTTNYGNEYHSAFEVDNIIGVQFHPEKSHKYGIKLFQNFVSNY